MTKTQPRHHHHFAILANPHDQDDRRVLDATTREFFARHSYREGDEPALARVRSGAVEPEGSLAMLLDRERKPILRNGAIVETMVFYGGGFEQPEQETP